MSSNDLDFDELHQQVSKLMDQATKPKKKAAKPTEPKSEVKLADKPAKTEPPEPPKLPKPEEKPVEKSDQEDMRIAVRRPSTAIVPRRKGVAMDIVQPAKQVVTPPSARPSRTSVTLQPTQQVVPEPPSPRGASVAPVTRPEPPTVADVPDETLATLNLQQDTPRKTILQPEPGMHATFPDPLEVHGFKDEDEPAAPIAPPTMQHAAVVSPAKDALLDDTDDSWGQPQQLVAESEPVAPQPTPETPFVNAKVEKRPLGAFATTPLEPPVQVEEIAPDLTPKEEKPAEVPAQAQPKELNPELVAVESAEPEFTPTQPQEDRQPSVNELRQMAIPPQYKATSTAPSKGDRPIFDTKTYHPPLQPTAGVRPAKSGGSKAGMILTLILILLVVIAGVGAYFVATGAIDVNSLLKSF